MATAAALGLLPSRALSSATAREAYHLILPAATKRKIPGVRGRSPCDAFPLFLLTFGDFLDVDAFHRTSAHGGSDLGVFGEIELFCLGPNLGDALASGKVEDLRTLVHTNAVSEANILVDPDTNDSAHRITSAPLLRHPARRDVARFALLLFQQRHFFDAFAEDADLFAARGDLDDVVA